MSSAFGNFTKTLQTLDFVLRNGDQIRARLSDHDDVGVWYYEDENDYMTFVPWTNISAVHTLTGEPVT